MDQTQKFRRLRIFFICMSVLLMIMGLVVTVYDYKPKSAIFYIGIVHVLLGITILVASAACIPIPTQGSSYT
jgi:hypothetical protein